MSINKTILAGSFIVAAAAYMNDKSPNDYLDEASELARKDFPTEGKKAVVRTLENLIRYFGARTKGSILYTGDDQFQFSELNNIRDAMKILKESNPDVIVYDSVRITGQPEGGLQIVDARNLIVCSPVTGDLKYFNTDSLFDKSKPAWLRSDPSMGPYVKIESYNNAQKECDKNFIKWNNKK